jgi:hypothetical protein
VTYLIGLVVADIMNILPFPRSALCSTHSLLKRLEQDLTMLLVECKAYADNTATAPSISRTAVASIELMHYRIGKGIAGLKSKLGATKVELSLRMNSDGGDDLGQWIQQAGKLEARS